MISCKMLKNKGELYQLQFSHLKFSQSEFGLVEFSHFSLFHEYYECFHCNAWSRQWNGSFWKKKPSSHRQMSVLKLLAHNSKPPYCHILWYHFMFHISCVKKEGDSHCRDIMATQHVVIIFMIVAVVYYYVNVTKVNVVNLLMIPPWREATDQQKIIPEEKVLKPRQSISVGGASLGQNSGVRVSLQAGGAVWGGGLGDQPRPPGLLGRAAWVRPPAGTTPLQLRGTLAKVQTHLPLQGLPSGPGGAVQRLFIKDVEDFRGDENNKSKGANEAEWCAELCESKLMVRGRSAPRPHQGSLSGRLRDAWIRQYGSVNTVIVWDERE